MDVKITSVSECVYKAVGNADAAVDSSNILLLIAITIRSLTYSITPLDTTIELLLNSKVAEVDAFPVKGFLYTADLSTPESRIRVTQ